MALFEGYERKIDKINGVLAQYGISYCGRVPRPFARRRVLTLIPSPKISSPSALRMLLGPTTVGAAIAHQEGRENGCRGSQRPSAIGLQAFCIAWLRG